MTVYVGAKEPEAVAGVIRTGTTGVDLSTVTAGRFIVRIPHPSGSLVTWSCALSEQSSAAVKLTHVFAAVELPGEVTEVPYPGKYVVVPEIAIGGVWRRCKPRFFVAEDIHGV